MGSAMDSVFLRGGKFGYSTFREARISLGCLGV